MTNSYGVRDANLKSSDALPASAGTVNGTVIDLGAVLTDKGARLAECELLLSAPALLTGALPDTVTATYTLQHSDTNFSAATLSGSCIVQTGNTGAAAGTFRMKLPSNCKRYIRASVVTATNAGNCAGSSMTLELLF